jgi:excisionase family DNA binding protein
MASNKIESPFLLVEQAAEYANLPLETIRKWIAVGKLRHARPGRRILIRKTDLVALIESTMSGGEALEPTG